MPPLIVPDADTHFWCRIRDRMHELATQADRFGIRARGVGFSVLGRDLRGWAGECAALGDAIEKHYRPGGRGRL